jgi:hypothetical protein
MTETGKQGGGMTDEQIKHLASRFLCWQLPRNFNPDHGISFRNPFPHLPQHWPSGTNLWGYDDAEAMVRHMVEGLPASAAHPSPESPNGENR